MITFCVSLVCTDKLGVENGDIPDANFEASDWQGAFRPFKARLNSESKWIAPSTVSSPWIQVDIGYTTSVSGLLTQGSGGSSWISKLKVSTFTGVDDPEVFIKDENDDDKVNIA